MYFAHAANAKLIADLAGVDSHYRLLPSSFSQALKQVKQHEGVHAPLPGHTWVQQFCLGCRKPVGRPPRRNSTLHDFVRWWNRQVDLLARLARLARIPVRPYARIGICPAERALVVRHKGRHVNVMCNIETTGT